jgi:hypothetical protein
MKDLRNDAARLSFLHDIGIISSEEVVQWADTLIVSEEKPSQALIELSTSSGKMVGDVLRHMAIGADVWSPVEAALPKILQHVLEQPTSAPIVARAFYHIAVTQRYEVPQHFRFILSAEDDFDLAESGVHKADEAYQWFVDDLKAALAKKEPNPESFVTRSRHKTPVEQAQGKPESSPEPK